jgi:prevent-host-death family protein
MKTIPIHKAKSTLSQLVKLATEGETIFIGSYGRPQAVLMSVNETKPKKRIGILADRLIVPDDFDAPLPEDVLLAFEETNNPQAGGE